MTDVRKGVRAMSREARSIRECRRVCRERLDAVARGFEEAIAQASGELSHGLAEAGRGQFAALKKSAHALFEPARAEARRRAAKRAVRLRRAAEGCKQGALQLREAAAQVKAGLFDEAAK